MLFHISIPIQPNTHALVQNIVLLYWKKETKWHRQRREGFLCVDDAMEESLSLHCTASIKIPKLHTFHFGLNYAIIRQQYQKHNNNSAQNQWWCVNRRKQKIISAQPFYVLWALSHIMYGWKNHINVLNVMIILFVYSVYRAVFIPYAIVCMCSLFIQFEK